MESASAVPSPEASAALPEPEVHAVPTSDGTEVRLTRYRMGTKGPSCSRRATATPRARSRSTRCPRTSSQYLGEHGYDVWLLDYRASPDLPSSYTQFTVDDIALRDWPAAIDTVRRESGEDSVQAMGHCVGGLSLFMAIGGGMEGAALGDVLGARRPPDPHAGQQAARLRAHGDACSSALGIKGLNTDYDPKSLPDGAVEAVMKRRCRSATSTTTRSRGASTSSTATSSTTRTSTRRRWQQACRASSATATSRSSSTSR